MEPRCKICQLRIIDPGFYEELRKLWENKESLRNLAKEAKKKFEKTNDYAYDISYSSFRRHIIAGDKH